MGTEKGVGLRTGREGALKLILARSSGAPRELDSDAFIQLSSACVLREDRVSVCRRSPTGL